jgi:hypothetical protein
VLDPRAVGLATSLALVGAYALAGELARSGGAYCAAFLRYESVMRDYVKQCHDLPPGGVGHRPEPARRSGCATCRGA